MDIERLQIEGGFLDGLDLKFSSGLNVIIGARGTGKTSVIELIRYALAARSHTTEAKNRSFDHARAILDGGEVTVLLNDLVDDITVSRTADDDKPRSTASFVAPIVLSQTEVETLGLSDAGRLSLIDGFINGRSIMSATEATVISSLKSIYKEILSMEAEIGSLSEEVTKVPNLIAQLHDFERQLRDLQGNSDEVAKKQSESSLLTEELAAASAREDIVARFGKHALEWRTTLDNLLLEDFGPDAWTGAEENDPVADLRGTYDLAISKIAEASEIFQKIENVSTLRQEEIASKNFEVERKARILRLELDKVSEGTGALSRHISLIRGQIAQINTRQSLLDERHRRLDSLRKRRDEAVAELEDIRLNRYTLRCGVTEKINNALAPYIKLEVEQSSQLGEYSKALTDALKGSGIKYNDLALKISENVSPRELVAVVDNAGFEELADLVDIPKERAARVIAQLREFGLADILTCDVQDDVSMYLLDGVDYKEVAALSAGQRCTVILSIVLQHSERVLIIDQPEDHLDNAFVANTIIKTLTSRKGHGQIILSTHNANIPVLGEADLVIELTSDGRNGFVQVNRPLNHPDAVNAITNVMEGGSNAFATRAKFYEDNSL
ncbi:AAA family ATPase [Pseudomonas sp. RIT357]|uniref:AAA family ATPase n=1 Tax=Pseudomonas sp. RIT357 TaxID=1470593 RepID=UPI0004537E9F|nr:AAA family ATPase [Pseudomonas sp. RIT357]EZP67259.1 chromosome segregation protein [Pseudomonas sp. RIT357]